MVQMMQLRSRPCRGTPRLHLHLLRLRFLALDAKGGESLEYDRVRGAREWVSIILCATSSTCIMFTFMHICVRYFSL